MSLSFLPIDISCKEAFWNETISFIPGSMQPPPNHVAMMQIDCEVVNTKLMHLENWLVPEKKPSSSQEPLKQHGNSTKSKENVENPQNSQGFLSPDARERLREIRKKSKGKETAKKSSSHS